MEYEYGHIRLCEVSDCGDNHRLKDLSICVSVSVCVCFRAQIDYLWLGRTRSFHN